MCPITGIQLQIVVIGCLQLDTHMIHMPIAAAIMASHLFLQILKLMESDTAFFVQTEFSISKFVIGMIN